MKRFLKYSWVLYVHVAIMVLAYQLAPLFGFGVSEKYYFKLTAAAWCIPPLFLLWCFRHTKARKTLIIFSIFAANNLIDELFFNPTVFGWNEWAAVILTTITLIRRNDAI